MRRLVILLLALNLAAEAIASGNVAPATISSSDQSTGFGRIVFNRYVMKPVGPVRELKREPLTKEQQHIADQAAQLAQNPSLLSMVLVERGQIIYEHYNYPARADRWQMSWSMSKSLTAYTLGTSLCNGNINSLDETAASLSPELRDTVYAEATIRDVLKMASGAPKAVHAGESVNGSWVRMIHQVYTGQEYVKESGVRGKGLFGPLKSGDSFSYLGINTLALESVIEARGGFLKQFEQNIWNKVGAERGASWLLDNNKRAIAQSGFTAHTRDWARLAMWSIDQIKGNDSCMRDYMRAATSRQIANYGDVGASYKSYGYQTWVGTFGPKPSYWWVGYGGQRVGVDPEKERIIVVFSWREDYMDQIHNLFGAWQRH